MSDKARRRRALFFLVVPGLVCACQTGAQPGRSASVSSQSLDVLTHRHEALIASRDEYEVSGGLGIWTDEQSISVRIDWLQVAGKLDLTLAGPMGIGTMQLLDDGDRATLTRGDHVIARDSSADRVLQQGLGLDAPVPLAELAFWIRGLPGNAHSARRDATGKLSTLQFTDAQGTLWQARFRRYADWDGAQVPALISASGGPYSVRVVLKNWQYATTTVVPDKPESNNRLPIPRR